MQKPADLIVTNAKIFTSNIAQPFAEAVAISGKRIAYVGDAGGAEKLIGTNTRVVDAHGATVTAGLIDSHFHLLWGAIGLGSAQLQDLNTADELRRALLEFANQNMSEPWVTGEGLKYSIIATRQELDTILADRPIYVSAYDGHTGWANTKALEMAGILHHGKAPGNGVVVRDAQGIATGELHETAMDLVRDLVPEPDDNRKRELFRMALQLINASGVTSVHNMNGDMEELTFYAAREDAGEMSLRVYTPLWIKPEMSEPDLQEAVEMARIQGEFARGGAVKFFMDGVWESYTALTLAPYADNPQAHSAGIYEADHFTRMAAACDRLGLQIFVHCCGDGAVRRALDGYEAVQKLNGKRDSRHRVEHIEVIHPDDLPRFRELGVIASMQTSHVPAGPNEGDIWPDRVGKDRWPLSFAWREIKNAGALLALGSDWTVASFDPLVNIHAAMNRKPWFEGAPDQRLTLEECLLGYTRDAAYAEFMENEKGQVREGFLADLVLFSHDLFQLPSEDILNAKVRMTVVDGKAVYEA